MRIILHDSNCFSISSTESLSSHIFRASYAVNSYENMKLNNIKKDLGHKYLHTTINSYINPEKRGLNLMDEENNGKKFGISALKERISKENYEKENSNLYNDISEHFNEIEEEGDDFVDDDFDLDDEYFYFTGHFYDDKDFLDYQIKTKMSNKHFDNEKEVPPNFEDSQTIEMHMNSNVKNRDNKNYLNLNFNFGVNESSSNKKNKGIKHFIGIKNFSDSVDIEESDNNMVLQTRIKNKKEISILTDEGKSIFEKTIALNRQGIYYNLGIKETKNIKMIMATNDIQKNTLIAIVGGKIFYCKDVGKLEYSLKGSVIESKYILYFRTAKYMYDRIIKIKENSIVNFLFNDNQPGEPNLDIKKISDENSKIRLIIITNKIIKKGDILSLDKTLLNVK